MRRTLVAALVTLMPMTAFADGPVTRRDGFLLLWNAIRRPAFESREKPFSDVPEGSPGFLEITYAKNRGILDDDEASFHPDAPLALGDGLLWLFRTRNIADLDDMTPGTMDALLERYPIASTVGGLSGALTAEELQTLARSLDAKLNEEVHEVSLYAEKFHGDGTAFGEIFNMHGLTAAHRTFPHNTLVRVTNVENGKSVVVRINDRGPFVEGRDMDLSLAAFISIAERSKGKIRATFQRIGDATMVGGCGGEPREQMRITRTLHLRPGVPHLFSLGKTLTLKANGHFVVRGVTYPDGTFIRMQDFILKDESYSFTPSVAGTYAFLLGSIEGRRRTMEMTVLQCEESPAVEPDTRL